MLVVALVGALGALGTLVVVLGVPGALVVVYLGVHLEWLAARFTWRALGVVSLGRIVYLDRSLEHLGAIGAFGVNGALVGAPLGVP